MGRSKIEQPNCGIWIWLIHRLWSSNW